VPVYGDGQQIRDWIHVRDHCAGIEAVRRKGRVGEVYNLGGKNERANLDITHLLLELIGKPRTLIEYVKDRPGHDRRYAIDCSKAERELGWSPRVPFDQGLNETIQWYRDNRSWIETIRSGEYKSYFETQYGKR
jgi:dTDP-glucose 4,6-dehydratase